MRSYKELQKLKTFEERYEYLRLDGIVGAQTFGYERYLNQMLYRSQRWRRARNDVIIRDDGCDLGIDDRKILDRILVHHMNPITLEDIENENPDIFNVDYLICTSRDTHNAIHYGDSSLLVPSHFQERRKNDTCPWRKDDA